MPLVDSAPSQVRAKELDARSDLFSLGAVLYEMATGDSPFHGESSAVICEAIVNRAPVAVVRLNHDVPPKLEDIINRALEKDRNLRYLECSRHAFRVATAEAGHRNGTYAGREFWRSACITGKPDTSCNGASNSGIDFGQRSCATISISVTNGSKSTLAATECRISRRHE